MPTERGPELGRWTLWPCPECADVIGRCDHDSRRRPVPAVPCDEAAVERLAEHLYTLVIGREKGLTPAWDQQDESAKDHWRRDAREAVVALRAAGEGGERDG